MEFVRPLEPILIIDDVKQIRADLSQVLAGLGFDDIIECDNFDCAKPLLSEKSVRRTKLGWNARSWT